MNIPEQPQSPRLSLEQLERIDQICNRFEQAQQHGETPSIEEHIGEFEGLERQQLLLELLLLDLAHHLPSEIDELEDAYKGHFPNDHPVIRKAIQKHRQILDQQESLRESVFFSEYTTRETPAERPAGIPRRLRYLEDYELLEEIARGGMGIVFKAKDRRDNRYVAIKMLLTGENATQAQIERFAREAKTAAKLEHLNIVRVYEVGYRDGSPYFVMDYVDGQNLETFQQSQPLSEVQAARFVKTAAQAIEYAHQMGILHRDLKPSNLLVDDKLRLRITDFGLAKMIGEGESLTLTGEIMGTPGFMPPEQASGKSQANQIGFASDVYGLGAVLYFLLTGRPPHQGDSVIEILKNIEKHDPPAPSSIDSSVSPDLEAISLKCLKKDPKKRYPSAAALAEDLSNWLLRKPIQAGQTSSARHPLQLLKRFAVAFSLSAVCLLILGFLLPWGRWFPSDGDTSVPNQIADIGLAVKNTGPDRLQHSTPPNTGAADSPKVAEARPLRATKPVWAHFPPPPPLPIDPSIGGFRFIGGLPQILRPSIPWKIAPPESRAIVVVRNLRDFSDKMDQVSELTGFGRLGILDRAMVESRINNGLKQDGSLMWVWGKPQGTEPRVTYYLPATNHSKLISQLAPQRTTPYHTIQAETLTLRTTPSGGYSLFCEEDAMSWMAICHRSAGGADQTLKGLNHYLARQDIGYAITTQGLAEGVQVGLPFSRGRLVVPTVLSQAAGAIFQEYGLKTMGSGTEIVPGGVRVSIAAEVDGGSQYAAWPTTMKLNRDSLLRDLPAGPAAMVVASSSCREWNDFLERSLKDLVTESPMAMKLQPLIDLDGFQGAVLLIQPYRDANTDHISTSLHLQIKVDDAHKAYQGVLDCIRILKMDEEFDSLRVTELKMDKRKVLEISLPIDEELRTSIDHPDELAVQLLQQVLITPLNENTLLIQGGDLPHLNEILASLNRGERLIDDPGISSTLRLLNGSSQQVILIDFHQCYRLAGQIYLRLLNEGSLISAFEVYFDHFKNAPPLGVGNHWEPQMIETQAVSPDELLRSLGDLSRSLPILGLLFE